MGKWTHQVLDHFLDLIVDVEVVNKKKAGGSSSLMEKMGCKRNLERMVGILNRQELMTNGSSIIMKLVRELKGNVVTIYRMIYCSLALHALHRMIVRCTVLKNICACHLCL